MPEAAGAVAAAAVADRMHAPKEDSRLAIVLVRFVIMATLFRNFEKGTCIIPLSAKTSEKALLLVTYKRSSLTFKRASTSIRN